MIPGVFNTAMFQSFMQSMNIPGMPGSKRIVQPPGADPVLPPNKTLYVNNIDDRINTERLKRELKSMFRNFGEVLEVVAMNSFWRRGQAFIIFKEQEHATVALTRLQGFPYNNKPLRINYARARSDIFTKDDGSYVERPSGPRKPRAIVEREQQLQQRLAQMQQQMNEHGGMPPMMPQPMASAVVPTAAPGVPPPPAEESGDKAAMVAALASKAADAMNARKRAIDFPTPMPQIAKLGAFQSPQQAMGFSMGDSMQPAMPNRTLFVQDVPTDGSAESLEALFSRYDGFLEVRLIASRGVAFVDYDTDAQAGVAMAALNGSAVSNHNLKITYAKR